MYRLHFKLVIITCLLAGYFTGCSVSEKKEIQSLYGYSMGTSYSIKVVGGLNEVRNLQLGIEGVLADINGRMSTYLPKSDLSKFATAQVGEAVSVDPSTIEVVQAALAIASITKGAFDPTIAPLVDLWGFGPTAQNKQKPLRDDIDQLLKRVGFAAIELDAKNHTLTKTAPRELDLSAIAKGYAVDQISHFLTNEGFTNYLVEVGGEMRFSGLKPNDEAWRIAIEKPTIEERVPFKVLSLNNVAVATSGDYRNFFEVDGVRYSHTIDPSTGEPVRHALASVTVVMASCMQADAYATAMLVMGLEEAKALAEAQDLAVFFISKDGEDFTTYSTPAFTELAE